MTERMIINKTNKLKELEQEKAELEKKIEKLKDEIKEDMENKGLEEMTAGNFIVRFKTVISNRLDSKALQKEHEAIYNQYLKRIETRRFTIA